MRPCAGPHGHTTWLGVWAAWFRRGVFRGCRAGRARHTFRVADGRAGDPAPSTVWCAGVALRLVRTMRASACATAEGAGGRVSTPPACLHRSSVGRGCRITRLGPPAGGSVLSSGSVLRRRRAACWQCSGGESSGAHLGHRREPGGGIGGRARCMPRGRGRRPRAVAVSLAREDRTTTPRWRARAKNCVLRRGRRVSGNGQKKEKSTTCEPSVLRRRAWSRPTRGLRSARTSPPRRARTAHGKGSG